MSNSISGVSNAQLYRCQVYRYFSGLSRLYLSVFKFQQTVPAFYLLFSDVAYFEGPVNWESADFYEGGPEDCIDLLLNTGIVGPAILEFPKAYAPITETIRLYLVNTPHSQIRIIAGSVARLDNVPADL